MLHNLNRWYNRIYALLRGYFWKRCPICGEMFGGHESAPTGLMMGWYQGRGVCQGCDSEARKRNAEWIEHNPFPVVEMVYGVEIEQRQPVHDIHEGPYGTVDEVTLSYLRYHTHADEAVKDIYTINGD